jgi:hypothetical protein
MVGIVEKYEGPGKIAALIVEGMRVQPVVEVLHSTTEAAKLVMLAQTFNSHSVDPLQPAGPAGLGDEIPGGANRPIEGLHEPLVICHSKVDRPVCLHNGGGVRKGSIQKELRH